MMTIAHAEEAGQTSIVWRVICAWCRGIMIEGSPHAPVSHGICDRCLDRVSAEEEIRKIPPRPAEE